MKRHPIPNDTVIAVLTEAGYRCAVPTCRSILALDIHHMEQVADGGGNGPGNLLPLCPTCHALYHRGDIQRDSIYAWKAILVSLSHAFDANTIDDLLFLSMPETQQLGVTADGVLRFSRLVASGLATFQCVMRNNTLDHYMAAYRVYLTERGIQLVAAWKSGNREAVAAQFNGSSPIAVSLSTDVLAERE